jgi:outer membrane lipopolysaccharide assembly protein LptE/RlpB
MTRDKRQLGKAMIFGLAPLFLAVIFLAGCGVGSRRMSPAELKARNLEREKAQLAEQLEQREVEIAQLQAQIKILSALPEGKRQNPYTISAVKITRLTSFYDKDGDGRREKLVVYFQPVDPDGDILKAAGSVSVQLWNLNNPSGQALLGQWQVQPQELRKLWFDSLVSSSYRLTFDAPVSTEALAGPLTVKATFADYFTGQLFSGQQVIEPRVN